MHAAGETARRNETPEAVDGSALDDISNDGRNLTLAAIERQAIEQRLKVCEGNKSQAAKSLGISLKTLYNRLAQYRSDDAFAGRE